jgi:beta-aspartyl-peptidase (threonine type)
MRNRLLAGLGVFILIPLLVIGETPQKKDDSPTTAIRKVLDDQVIAWNKGDLKAFMEGYWNDEKLSFFSGKNRTLGWKATLERYQNRYQAEGKEMGKLAFTEMDIEPLGDKHALVRSNWELTLTKEKVGGLFTLIVEKTPQGWKVIHDHTSN